MSQDVYKARIQDPMPGLIIRVIIHNVRHWVLLSPAGIVPGRILDQDIVAASQHRFGSVSYVDVVGGSPGVELPLCVRWFKGSKPEGDRLSLHFRSKEFERAFFAPFVILESGWVLLLASTHIRRCGMRMGASRRTRLNRSNWTGSESSLYPRAFTRQVFSFFFLSR